MLEKLKNKLDQGVAAVSVKSESLMETTRTRNSIAAKQKEAEVLKFVLGGKVHTAWQAGPVTIDMFTEDLNAISAIEAEIAALNAHLQEIKENEAQALNAQAAAAAAANQKYCPTCGKALPASCRFCDACGSPLT